MTHSSEVLLLPTVHLALKRPVDSRELELLEVLKRIAKSMHSLVVPELVLADEYIASFEETDESFRNPHMVVADWLLVAFIRTIVE